MEMEYLGYMNSWFGDIPEIVKICKELQHRTFSEYTKNTVEKISCPRCGYYYLIDSSG